MRSSRSSPRGAATRCRDSSSARRCRPRRSRRSSRATAAFNPLGAALPPGRNTMRIRVPSAAALALAAALAYGAPASADDRSMFSFSGYGTVGVAHSSNGEADYLVDEFKPNGPGHAHSWSPDVDTRLGLQASAQFSPRLSVVVQVITQQRYDDTYRPEV